MIEIILKIIICQFVFLLIYETLLKRETFFQWNRVYLLATAVLSIIIPFLRINWFRKPISEKVSTTINEIVLYASASKKGNDIQIIAEESSNFSFSIEHFYVIGCAIFAVLFFRKLYLLHQLKQKSRRIVSHEFVEYRIPNSTSAFSFMNCFFIGENVKNESYSLILKHELVHIKQKHSYDLLFFELLRIFLWFNPLLYLYQKYSSEIHEFIADQNIEKTKNYETLLQEIFGTENFSFTNSFSSKSLLQKRIIMLNKKSKKMAGLKYLSIVPSLLLVLFLTSSILTQAQDLEKMNDEEMKQFIYDELRLKSAKGVSAYEQLSRHIDKEKYSEDEIQSKETYYKFMMLMKLMAEESIEKGIIKESEFPNLNKIGRNYDEYVKWKKQEIENNKKSELIQTNQYLVPADVLNEETITFTEINQVPLFENCEKDNSRDCFQNELQNHIKQSFYYPKEAIEKNISGKVFVSFIIKKDGAIAIKAIRAPDEILEKCVYELMLKIPKLKPAIHQGKKVNMSMSIPITFKLDSTDDDKKK
jgi:beta-lactamase regulating signal transducer with metallopeptidase domain